MKILSTAHPVLALAMSAVLCASAPAQRTYCATLGGQIYELDIAAFTTTPAAATGVNLLFGIANLSSPTELLISGVTAGRFHVDLTTGTTTPLTGSGLPMFALCNNEDNGKVYAASLGNLYEVDATTGAETLIGVTGLINIYGLDYVPSLGAFVANNPITNSIYTLDPVTGSSTLIGPTNMSSIVGIWYDRAGGKLYGICDQNNAGCVVELSLATGAATSIFDTGMNLVSIGGDIGGGGIPTIGTSYCTPVANSTGVPAAMSAIGSTSVAMNNVLLKAEGMPFNSFGLFLTSQLQGFAANPGGSQGNLCLGGAIGRYVGPGQIQNSGLAGEIELSIDLTMHPTPTGIVAVQAGETWNFTAWYRDAVGGSATSNFADGLEISFL
ncbi:hypothetical protein [Planctomycetes bacterium Poly30]